MRCNAAGRRLTGHWPGCYATPFFWVLRCIALHWLHRSEQARREAVAAAGEIVMDHGWPRQNTYRRVREASLDSVDLLLPDVRIARGLSRSAGPAVLHDCFQPVSGNRLA